MAAQVARISIRNFTLFRSLEQTLREPLKAVGDSAHDEASAKTWKTIFLYVCIPAIGLSAINCHLAEEQERPEFKPYEHLRLRAKRYPWGDGNKTLFHNPHMNALPDGYET